MKIVCFGAENQAINTLDMESYKMFWWKLVSDPSRLNKETSTLQLDNTAKNIQETGILELRLRGWKNLWRENVKE